MHLPVLLEVMAFNRTIVELKLLLANAAEGSLGLLIEPLWNWNKASLGGHYGILVTFNRTIVELKLDWLGEVQDRDGHLLIEPLWNWNQVYQPLWLCRSLLLIEPLWNWNLDFEALEAVEKPSFNRTIVELKRCWCFLFLFFFSLLIEPLWNWNVAKWIGAWV